MLQFRSAAASESEEEKEHHQMDEKQKRTGQADRGVTSFTATSDHVLITDLSSMSSLYDVVKGNPIVRKFVLEGKAAVKFYRWTWPRGYRAPEDIPKRLVGKRENENSDSVVWYNL